MTDRPRLRPAGAEAEAEATHQQDHHTPGPPVVALALLALGPITVLLAGETLQAWRTVALIGFCLTCPGIVLARRIHDLDTATRSLIVVTVSLAVTAVCSESLAVARVWSAPGLVGVLSTVGVVGLWFDRRLETTP